MVYGECGWWISSSCSRIFYFFQMSKVEYVMSIDVDISCTQDVCWLPRLCFRWILHRPFHIHIYTTSRNVWVGGFGDDRPQRYPSCAGDGRERSKQCDGGSCAEGRATRTCRSGSGRSWSPRGRRSYPTIPKKMILARPNYIVKCRSFCAQRITGSWRSWKSGSKKTRVYVILSLVVKSLNAVEFRTDSSSPLDILPAQNFQGCNKRTLPG